MDNPNVNVINAARDAYPKDHHMYGALDHAAAELAVLHLRCQRAGLSDAALPSRFQLGDEVNASGRHGTVVGVTFANVDFHDGCGSGGKIYYTIEYPDGRRSEFISNDVNPLLKLVSCGEFSA